METVKSGPITGKKQVVNSGQVGRQLTKGCLELHHPMDFGWKNARRLILQTDPKKYRAVAYLLFESVRKDKEWESWRDLCGTPSS